VNEPNNASAPDAKNRGVLVFWLHKNCKGYLNVYGKLLAQVTGAVIRDTMSRD